MREGTSETLADLPRADALEERRGRPIVWTGAGSEGMEGPATGGLEGGLSESLLEMRAFESLRLVDDADAVLRVRDPEEDGTEELLTLGLGLGLIFTGASSSSVSETDMTVFRGSPATAEDSGCSDEWRVGGA